MVYCPYLRRLESVAICRSHYKGSKLSYLKTLSVGLCQDLNLGPPTQQSDALPTELHVTGQHIRHNYFMNREYSQLCSYSISTIPVNIIGHHLVYIFIVTINVHVLAFYRKCRLLIGYATHALFCDR